MVGVGERVKLGRGDDFGVWRPGSDAGVEWLELPGGALEEPLGVDGVSVVEPCKAVDDVSV